jgi:hypothetical protein
VFLHPVGSVGYIVLSGVSGVQNVDALLFVLRWAQSVSHKKHTETRYTNFVFLYPVGSMGHVVLN